MSSSVISCISQKEITYFQEDSANTELDTAVVNKAFEAIIQPGDILSVYVTSLSIEASRYFNYADEKTSNKVDEGYLVGVNGSIEIPLIGTVTVAALTTQMAQDSIKNKLEKYLKSPTIQVRFKNFRVVILGEVNKPGVFISQNEKMNLTEALGMAGDLTIYGRRDNVLIIREVDGNREFVHIDITSRDFFKSPYYYLRSGDLVYIEPRKEKRATAEGIYKTAPLIISTLTLLALILVNTLR